MKVIVAYYSGDSSGFEVLRIYEDEQRARQDFELIQQAECSKIVELRDAPFFAADGSIKPA